MIKFESLPYRPLRITSGYGDRTAQVKNIPGATRWHDGVDIGRDRAKYPSATGHGGNVLAVMDGVITERGYNSARGNYIKIKHANENGKTVETLYQHLHSTGLPTHSQVKAGQTIGRMGATGVGAGLHLHFELRVDDKPVDPTRYLNQAQNKKENEEMEKKIKITLNGVVKTVTAIEKNGNNFVKLQDLRDEKITIGFENKMPTIKSI